MKKGLQEHRHMKTRKISFQFEWDFRYCIFRTVLNKQWLQKTATTTTFSSRTNNLMRKEVSFCSFVFVSHQSYTNRICGRACFVYFICLWKEGFLLWNVPKSVKRLKFFFLPWLFNWHETITSFLSVSPVCVVHPNTINVLRMLILHSSTNNNN